MLWLLTGKRRHLLSDFDKKIGLKEKADEEMYFARRDRELIRALHEKQSVQHPMSRAEEKDDKSVELQEDSTVEVRARWYDPGTIARYLRKITEKTLRH